MIPVHCFDGKKVALFGLGASGLATAEALIAGGAKVVADDDSDACKRNAIARHIMVADLHQIVWDEVAALVLAPGVPLTHPEPHWVVKLAHLYGVEIIGDIELFVRERSAFLASHHLRSCDCPFVAVTGTNGKSTTTALITHLLQQAGYDVQMGGNIGTALLSLAPLQKNRFYVVECSSFQIDLAPSLNPTVGLLLNLTPDHLDRHGSFAHYARVKEHLIAGSDCALVSVDDVACQQIADRQVAGGRHIIACQNKRALSDGYFLHDRKIYFSHHNKTKLLADLSGITTLRGAHNGQNAMMAIATMRALGVSVIGVQKALSGFAGLPHRMQFVRRFDDILFINDSKATNAEAAAPALTTFAHIYWIIGGVIKQGGIQALRHLFSKVQKAYLIGEAADSFAQTIGDAFPFSKVKTLDVAVQQALEDARLDHAPEKTVLLSPACASYDQFLNYQERGDTFIQLVNQL